MEKDFTGSQVVKLAVRAIRNTDGAFVGSADGTSVGGTAVGAVFVGWATVWRWIGWG